jgi:hypothetical protein
VIEIILYICRKKNSDMTEQEKELTLFEAITEAIEQAGISRKENLELYMRSRCARSQGAKGKLGVVRAGELLEQLAPGKYEIIPPMVRRKN